MRVTKLKNAARETNAPAALGTAASVFAENLLDIGVLIADRVLDLRAVRQLLAADRQ